jgi:hypothetical protein
VQIVEHLAADSRMVPRLAPNRPERSIEKTSPHAQWMSLTLLLHRCRAASHAVRLERHAQSGKARVAPAGTWRRMVAAWNTSLPAGASFSRAWLYDALAGGAV